jgi:hypothetical protein
MSHKKYWILLAIISGCASQQHTEQRLGQHQAAMSLLNQAQTALAKHDSVTALKIAAKAHDTPLDLQDVVLIRKIDDALMRASQDVLAQSRTLLNEGRYYEAAELSQTIAATVPHDRQYAQWATEVKNKAIAAYLNKAQHEMQNKHLVMIYASLAKRLGAEAFPPTLSDKCLISANVTVARADHKTCEICSQLSEALSQDLSRDVCLGQLKPLNVRIVLNQLQITNLEDQYQGAKSLPGFNVKTEEEYQEDVGYAAIEDVTETQTHIEKQERRDCAPRPGEDRGCRTWLEDTEIKVAVTSERLVPKTKRVSKMRPLPGPFAPEQVVTFDVQRIRRDMLLTGEVSIEGAAQAKGMINTHILAEDTAHAAVEKQGFVLPADPMEAMTFADVEQAAVKQTIAQVRVTLMQGLRNLAQEKMAAHKDDDLAALLLAEPKLADMADVYCRTAFGVSAATVATLMPVQSAPMGIEKTPLAKPAAVPPKKPAEAKIAKQELDNLEAASLEAAQQQDAAQEK